MVNRTVNEGVTGKYYHKSSTKYLLCMCTLVIAPAPPSHAIFFAMAASSLMNSNVGKFHRGVEDFEEVDQTVIC